MKKLQNKYGLVNEDGKTVAKFRTYHTARRFRPSLQLIHGKLELIKIKNE